MARLSFTLDQKLQPVYSCRDVLINPCCSTFTLDSSGLGESFLLVVFCNVNMYLVVPLNLGINQQWSYFEFKETQTKCMIPKL